MTAQSNGKKSPMNPAAEMAMKARQSAADWVSLEKQRTGSRTKAMEIVASSVGISPDWLRRFVNGNDRVKQPSWHVGHNIIALYNDICQRIEANNNKRRAIIARLEEIRHAATQSHDAERAAPMERSESTGGIVVDTAASDAKAKALLNEGSP